MRPSYRKMASGVVLGLAAVGGAQAQAQKPDPYLWLEDVGGDKPLAWVKEQNAVALKELQAQPDYPGIHERLKTILNSKERIPYVTKHGDFYYNFWRDAQHTRGIWRRTTLEQYQKAEPQWETVLDIDKLAAEENENWVWHGVSCLYPKGEQCLVQLSRGGGDAHVVREFDVAKRRFVTDGFNLPEAKSDIGWIDADTIFVSTDFGEGSMTTSGYPRIVKEWKRGTPLAAAATLYEAKAEDLGVGAYKDFTPGHS